MRSDRNFRANTHKNLERYYAIACFWGFGLGFVQGFHPDGCNCRGCWSRRRKRDA